MTQKRILVVDDEAPMRKLLSINLEACGYHVDAACDGFEALRLLNEQPFDLVLLDVGMPGLDGLQILEIVRQSFAIPIIIVSARSTESDKLAAFSRGADDYLAKPFGVDDLVACIAPRLGNRT